MKESRNILNYLMATVFAMVISVFLFWVMCSTTFLHPVLQAIEQFSLSDMYYRVDWSADEPPEMSDQVTLIDITMLRDRAEIARVISEVELCDPLVMGIDVIFEGEKCDTFGDMFLREAAELATNAVFACKLVDYNSEDDNFEGVVSSFFTAQSDTVFNQAYTNVVGDAYTTCLRRFSVERNLHGQPVHSLAAAVVGETAGYEVLPADEPSDGFFIDYAHVDFPVVKHDSVLVNPDLIKGRIVLIGALTEEADMHVTPIGKMPGLKVQAYMVHTLLSHRNIATMPVWGQIVLSFLLVFFTVWFQTRLLAIFQTRDSLIGVFCFNSELLMRIITFAILAVVAYLSYVLYAMADYYIPMTYILVPVTMAIEGRGLHATLVKVWERNN